MSHEDNRERSLQDKLISLLESTGSDIGRLSATCCQPNKSKRMQALLRSYKMVSQPNQEDSYDRLIEFVEKTGGIVGSMHVTCCSPDREEIYQRLLNQVNQIFMLAWQLKGVSHE